MTQHRTSHNEQNDRKIKLFYSRKETTRIMEWNGGFVQSLTDPTVLDEEVGMTGKPWRYEEIFT